VHWGHDPWATQAGLPPSEGDTDPALVPVRRLRSGLAALTFALLCLTAPAQAGAASGLVAAYSFNEGSGTTVGDASGSGNAGTVSNTTWTTAGKYGGALTFNGTTSWVTVNDSPSLDLRTAVTIEGWVRPSSLGGSYRTVVIKQQTSQLIYDLYASNNSSRPVGDIYITSDHQTQGTAKLPLNTWTFLADTWDGSTLRLYVNGTQVSSASVTGTMPTSTAPLRIGGNSVWNEWFSGQIDEVRVYNRALSATELQSDMNTPVSADTVAPSTPTGLRQTSATTTSVSIAWNASTDNVGVTGYDLKVNGNAAGTSTGTTATLSGLACGTSPTVGVDAYDAAGNRSAVAMFAAATSPCPDTTAPSAPGSLTQTDSTATSVTVSWTASTDNVAVTGYDLYLDGVPAGTTAATAATFSSLTCGAHTVGVDAYDAAGNRSVLSTLVARTSSCPDTTPPTAPTGLTQTGATTGSVTVSWTAATDNVGVTGYDLYLDGVPAGTTTSTSATLASLACGSAPTVGVDAYDAAGNYSTIATLVTVTSPCPDTTAPSVPTGLTQTGATQTSATISWTASTDDVAVAGYGLYDGGQAPIASTGNTNYTFTGLACGTSYTRGVDAYDAVGNRSGQATISAATDACDVTPPAVSITAPGDGSTVSGTITVSATASDNVGVAGVQFKLDGSDLGSEVTTSPYSNSWNTTTATNDSHSLTAVARDAAGNTTTSSAVSLTVSNTVVATPTPVPAASVYGVSVGNGFVEASAREVVRTTGNVVYVITTDDNTCQGGGSAVIRAWKGTGAQPGNASVPIGFTEVDAAHHPTAPVSGDCTYTGGVSASLGSPDVRLDPNGVVHLVYVEGSSASVYYQTFSAVTDTWGPRTVIGTGYNDDGSSWPRYGQAALTLDANNAPQVVYMTKGTSNQVMFTNKASGSWSTPTPVAAGTNAMHPSLVTSLDGTLHLAWLDNSLATQPVIKYSHYASGGWSAVESVTTGDSVVLANGDSDQGPSVATDSANRPHVLFMDGTVSGSNDYVRMRFRSTGGVWTDETPPGGIGGASNASATWFAHTPQNYISNTDGEYVFLGHDVNVEFGYQYQLGGVGTNWGVYSTLDPQSKQSPVAGDTCEPGTDGSASIRFDPLRDNNSGIIDVIYFDERDDSDCTHHHARVFYRAIVIGSDVSSDTTPPTAPSNLTQTGSPATTVLASWSASIDNVGVAGYGLYQGSNAVGFTTSTSYTFTGLACGTSYSFGVDAYDAAGNRSTQTTINASTAACDTNAPSVQITTPADGSTVSGQVSVAASASDDVGVVGVQFLLDGNNLGAEQTTPPYGLLWNTTTVTNGQHTLKAIARDAAGNRTTSATVTVTIGNTTPPPIAFVKSLGTATAENTGGSLALTVPAGGVAAGDTVVVAADMSGGGGVTISTITDTRGNTYTVDSTLKHPSTGVNTFIGSGYIATPLQAGDKITITFAASYYSERVMAATEFRGLSAVGRLDKLATGTGTSTTPASAATATTTAAPELVIGGFGTSSAATFTPATGFTALASATVGSGSNARSVYECYQVVQATGQYRASGTLSVSSYWTAATATYH
jgi:chitodextrinase